MTAPRRSRLPPASTGAESETRPAPRARISARSRALLICALCGLIAAVAVGIPQFHDWQENVDLFILFRARGKQPTPTHVVMVPIDRRAAQSIGVPKDPVARAQCRDLIFASPLPASHEELRPPHLLSQWPRCLLARAVMALRRAGASVIVLDILFRTRNPAAPGDAPHIEEGDRMLADTMRAAGNVLIAQRIEGEGDAPAIVAEIISDAAMGEAPFLLPRDNPTFAHRFFTLERNAWDNVSMPLLALQMHTLPDYPVLHETLIALAPQLRSELPASVEEVRDARHLQAIALILRSALHEDSTLAARVIAALQQPRHADMTPPQRVHLAALVRAYAGKSERYFNFRGPPGTLQAVRFEKLVAGDDVPDLTGKVAFVGLAEYGSPEQYEHFPTVWRDRDGFDHGGVELAATAYSNLLEDDAIDPVTPAMRMIIVFALAGFVAWICFLYTSGRALLITVAICSLYLAIALMLFEQKAMWLPVLGSAVAVALSALVAFTMQYLELKHQYLGLYEVLGMFVPRAVVERLVNNAERLAWIRDSAYGACVATDGERYTALADRMTPVELSRFLNRYFQTLFPPVASREGWVSDVVGDSMLAVWAEARATPRVREQACQAALEMLAAIQEFNTSMPTRIGVDFGPIALATLGAGAHWEYRPVGSVPNTANRLQALNKRLGTKLLVSQSVIEGLQGFLARDLGLFLLRGKETPTRVFELIAKSEHATESQAEVCKCFEIALAHFQSGAIEDAAAGFRSIAERYDDAPSRFFLSLCHQQLPREQGIVIVAD